jgi:hypothetical protein
MVRKKKRKKKPEDPEEEDVDYDAAGDRINLAAAGTCFRVYLYTAIMIYIQQS